MRKILISREVWDKIVELKTYLVFELQLSETAATRRMDRIGIFLHSLRNPGDYALCRFARWRESGYRCAAFEGWVFAYEIVPEGVIVRDMSHAKALKD